MILIDINSTHNFLKQGLTKKLRLEAKDQPAIDVTIRDISKLQCTNKGDQVEVIIHHVAFKVDLFTRPIGGIDVFLEV